MEGMIAFGLLSVEFWVIEDEKVWSYSDNRP